MFTLTIEDSNGQIADRFSFDHGAYVIGRHESCDIVLPSSSVSRQHARIFIDNGRCYVEDLGSSNGVVVDGQRVIKERDLGTASQLRVGDFYLYLEYKRPDRGRQNVLQTLFINDENGGSKLVRINDSFAGEEFSLSETENSIGRTDENFILLSDASISRQHAKIVRSGNDYTVMDLGSSNGTKLNGKKLKTTATLKHGDRVEFGNVEFVFAPGDAQVNPADYAGSMGSNSTVLVIGITVLVLLALVAGGVIVFGFWSFKNKQEAVAVDATQTVEQQIASHISEGQRQLERRDWAGSLRSFNDALALDPANEVALELKSKAEREREALDQLEEGERLLEEGLHEDARGILLEIPKDTQAWERAQPTLEHIRTTLAYQLKNEAIRLAKSDSNNDLKSAHQKIVKSLELVGDDEEAIELVTEIESQLSKKKIKFERYSNE